MTARSPSAFLLSAALHGLLVAVALLLAYAFNARVKEEPKVFELVAGPGDNYAATDAPALGVSGGIKLTLPDLPAPPPAPEPPAPAPVVTPAPEPVISKAPLVKPAPKTPVHPAEPVVPNLTRQLRHKLIRKESQVKQQIKKERAAEQKRLSKEEFDREHRAARTASAASVNPKVKHIDAEGIAEGVAGGSTANKTGGAGGQALHREQGELMEAYYALVKRRLKEALDKPPGLSDSLTAVAEFKLGADGSISGAHISRSSGSAGFDQAVLDAIGRYRSVGARPDKKSEISTLTFHMKEDDDG